MATFINSNNNQVNNSGFKPYDLFVNVLIPMIDDSGKESQVQIGYVGLHKENPDHALIIEAWEEGELTEEDLLNSISLVIRKGGAKKERTPVFKKKEG